MTTKDIDGIVRPFTAGEAKAKIGNYIIKRPGVFSEDDGNVYRIVDSGESGFTFWEKDHLHKSYRFENIIYDYLFEDESFIGTYK